MSRVGRQPIAIPPGVQVSLEGGVVKVKGPRGELALPISRGISVGVEKDTLTFHRESDRPPVRALHGLMRSLVNNMVIGVSQGFERQLEVRGTGYRVSVSGSKLTMKLGFSHDVEISFPPDIEVKMLGTATRDQLPTSIISISGIDKEKVGHWADQVRRAYPPEPYKGKGIRYVDEYVRRKAGKTG